MPAGTSSDRIGEHVMSVAFSSEFAKVKGEKLAFLFYPLVEQALCLLSVDTSCSTSYELTVVDRQTLTMFAVGRSCAQIAEARDNSTVTVRNTLYRVQEKLGVSNKQGLVIWAVRNGLLDDVEVGR